LSERNQEIKELKFGKSNQKKDEVHVLENRLYSSFFKQNTNTKERVKASISISNDESEYLRQRKPNDDVVTSKNRSIQPTDNNAEEIKKIVRKLLAGYEIDKRLESCEHRIKSCGNGIESLNKHSDKLFKSTIVFNFEIAYNGKQILAKLGMNFL
jgi:hypothetical protein